MWADDGSVVAGASSLLVLVQTVANSASGRAGGSAALASGDNSGEQARMRQSTAGNRLADGAKGSGTLWLAEVVEVVMMKKLQGDKVERRRVGPSS